MSQKENADWFQTTIGLVTGKKSQPKWNFVIAYVNNLWNLNHTSILHNIIYPKINYVGKKLMVSVSVSEHKYVIKN